MIRSSRNQTGFTFVELMITMAFLSIAILAVTSQFPLGLSVSQSAEDLTLETNLAQELMEEIKTIPWNLIDTYDGLSENPPEDLGGNPLDGTGGRANFSQYRRSVIVRYADPVTFDTTSVPSQLKRVEISVANTNNGHSTTLMMIMAEKP
ncbi:prepilin-type N-terminal cleavage/methylation domain-containing protein [Candidatus Zixiibacteriota bacterium]